LNPNELTTYIHKHIPITFNLGAKVEEYNGESIIISAPIEPNLNHRNTAFGGSISALGILSGWALIFLKLRELGIKNRLVIQKSSFDFFEPIENEFKACCCMPANDEWTKFIKTLNRHGRARISVQSKIESQNGDGGKHFGTYVAILPEK
jgi:thioesterase domain-containing protein